MNKNESLAWFSGIGVFVAGLLPQPFKLTLIILSVLAGVYFVYNQTKQ